MAAAPPAENASGPQSGQSGQAAVAPAPRTSAPLSSTTNVPAAAASATHRQEAVRPLDAGRRVEGGQELAVAERPVRAAQTGSGHTDDPAPGHHEKRRAEAQVDERAVPGGELRSHGEFAPRTAQCGTSSFSGRALCTTGMRAKLYGCGGDVVAHSSVSPSHGSSPAGLPLPRTMLWKTFQRNTMTAAAMRYAPSVETRFSGPHSGDPG